MPNVKQIQPPGESSDPAQQEKCSLNEWMAKRVKAIQKLLNKSQLNVGRSSTKNDDQGATFPFRLMRLFLVCDNKTMSCAYKRPLISCSPKQRVIHSAHPKIFQAIKYPLKGAGARALKLSCGSRRLWRYPPWPYTELGCKFCINSCSQGRPIKSLQFSS